ncbi:MAG TPA: hypothetical protein VH061_07530 [Solirubrobacteraceae bacterium]|jgi:hypothetical protein|nr:hypothetical protein [Solirubrobacteraceae bacterium]
MPPPRALLRLLLALALGAAAALLVACGSSGKGLIPAAAGGPLQSDIEAVEHAAEAGNGNCSGTEAALLKTDQDYAALPSTLDSGLRSNIRQGIENLRKVAKEACTQPLVQTTTTTTPKTTSTATTPTTTTPTTTTPTTPTEETTPPTEEEAGAGGGPGGGTPAPGEGQAGEGVGGAGPTENEAGNGAGGSEGTK